ncbi:zinc ribbon domain-containing protein [Pseudomonas aeruginosa]|uniref:zinc ribbon domain-containing protein n=1 Tax=Pseudomonas aeruginosa TaxID=287 RepID=UPI003749E7EC
MCGYKDKKNRKNNNKFECKECKFKCDNDDVVAYVNIVKQYRVLTDEKVKQI